MKKLLSILMLLVAIVTGAWADDLCSVTFPSDLTSKTGSGIEGTNCTYSYAIDDPSNVKVWNQKSYYKFGSSGNVTITYEAGFQAGDKVTVAIGNQNSSQKTIGFLLKSSSGSGTTASVAGNTATTMEYELKAADIESDGKTIKIYRGGSNSSDARFHSFTVTGTRSGKTLLAGAWSAAAPKFVTGSTATIPTFALTNTPAVDAKNYTITYSVQSGNLANVNASTGITAINTETAGTATVRATLALTTAGEESYELPDPAYYDCVITVEDPKVEKPSLVLPMGSYDYEKGGYKFQVSCATEGATYSYKLKGASSFTELTTYSEGGKDYVYMVGDGSKNIIIKASKAGLPDSEEVEISKWNGDNAFVLNVAPSTTSPESIVTFSTSADQYDKDQLHQYRSFNVAGTYIAGIDGSDGLKMRCNRAFKAGGQGDDINGFALAVTPGYKITKVQITKLISNRAGTIEADEMYVDGSAYEGFEPFTIPASDGTAVTKTYDGLNATSQIAWKLTPGKYDSGKKDVDQFRFKVTVTYVKTPEVITIGKGGYSTFAGEFNYTVSGAKAFAAQNKNTSVGFTEIPSTTIIPANTGVVLQGTEGDEVTITYTTADAGTVTTDMVGVTEANPFVASSNVYVIATKAAGTKFYKYTGSTFPLGKAYLNAAVNAPGSLDIDFGGETAINGIDANDNANSAAPVKVIKNGKLYIGNYNVAGQQVK